LRSGNGISRVQKPELAEQEGRSGCFLNESDARKSDAKRRRVTFPVVFFRFLNEKKTKKDDAKDDARRLANHIGRVTKANVTFGKDDAKEKDDASSFRVTFSSVTFI
jgi:hypothetical protein